MATWLTNRHEKVLSLKIAARKVFSTAPRTDAASRGHGRLSTSNVLKNKKSTPVLFPRHCVGVCGRHVVKDETKGDSAFPDVIFLLRPISHRASRQSSPGLTKKEKKKTDRRRKRKKEVSKHSQVLRGAFVQSLCQRQLIQIPFHRQISDFPLV